MVKPILRVIEDFSNSDQVDTIFDPKTDSKIEFHSRIREHEEKRMGRSREESLAPRGDGISQSLTPPPELLIPAGEEDGEGGLGVDRTYVELFFERSIQDIYGPTTHTVRDKELTLRIGGYEELTEMVRDPKRLLGLNGLPSRVKYILMMEAIARSDIDMLELQLRAASTTPQPGILLCNRRLEVGTIVPAEITRGSGAQ